MINQRIEYKEGDIIGTAIFIKELSSNNGRRAMFKCKCGNLFDTYISKMKRGVIKGCGCWNIKHGHTVGSKKGGKRTAEYKAWTNMLRRCFSPTNVAYMNYGGRGITVCERWENSFEFFIQDMGLKPSPRFSLERINNNGNYEPSNCKWDIKKNQARNTRSNVFITYNNETLCMSAWAEKLNISNGLFWRRLMVFEWTMEKIIKVGRRKCTAKKVINTITGEIFDTIGKAALSEGIKRTVLSRKLNNRRLTNDTPFIFYNT